MRALDFMPPKAVYRYVVARGMVYRLQPVTSLRLAEHGWASIEGSAELQRLRREQEEEEARLQAQAWGAPAEEAELQVEQLRTAKARHAQEAMDMVRSTRQGIEDLHARQRAYVCASVCGIGVIQPEGWDEERHGPLEHFLGLMPPDWVPGPKQLRDLGDGALFEVCSVVEAVHPQPGETAVEAVQRLHGQGQLSYGADFEPDEHQVLFLAARSVADGRARRAAGFRVAGGPPQGADPSPRGGEREDSGGGAGDAS